MIARIDSVIHMIPLEQITILNPRQRGKKKFQQISNNIAKLGLKKPVTVARVNGSAERPTYNLVCGQGRYETYKAMGQTVIPAFVIIGSKEQQMLISLAENLARRYHTAVELVTEVRSLHERGYKFSEIAQKIDLDVTYVRGIVKLLEKGEERLLMAVEKGQLPLSVAMTIATSDDKTVQRELAEAYERNDLRGKALLRARRLIESRRSRGKAIRRGVSRQQHNGRPPETLLKTYQKETARQRLVIQKSKISETRLLFVVSAMRQLLRDENFVNLLRAEGLDTMPQYLAEQVKG